ncbi:MAG: hypothetical protein KDC90_06145, partial [Ignavibacteriae bacterium]|nr:hypothetical protein [Ignavibacteriota bacterium]
MYSEEIKTVADTLNTVVAKEESSAGWIMHHILDSSTLELPFITVQLPHLSLFGFDISITKHVVFMWIAFALLITTFYFVSKSYKKSF